MSANARLWRREAAGQIWDFANFNGFAIVTKDSDFVDRSVLASLSPKIIWIRLGNCTTGDVETLLRVHYEAIRQFLEHDVENCLTLGRE